MQITLQQPQNDIKLVKPASQEERIAELEIKYLRQIAIK